MTDSLSYLDNLLNHLKKVPTDLPTDQSTFVSVRTAMPNGSLTLPFIFLTKGTSQALLNVFILQITKHSLGRLEYGYTIVCSPFFSRCWNVVVYSQRCLVRRKCLLQHVMYYDRGEQNVGKDVTELCILDNNDDLLKHVKQRISNISMDTVCRNISKNKPAF